MKHGLGLILLAALSLSLTYCSSSPDTSPEGLRAVIGENKIQTDACYQKVLKKQPDLGSGTVQLKFLINEEGKAYKTVFMKKKSTLSNKVLNACLKKVVHSWQFPTGKSTDVTYDFNFDNGSGESAGEPDQQNDLDVIDTSPQDDGQGPGDEETPAE